MSLTQVRIILVEPAGPLNVGSVARVMKNMALERLILVNPQCDPLSEEAKRMAVHGIDVLEQAQRVSSLPEALQGCQRAIATTGRPRTSTSLETPKNALPWLLTPHLTSALIFGPEDRGLSNEELNYAQRFVCIPSNSEYPSLNLAQSVAVCTYELYQAAQNPQNVPPYPATEPASLDILEGYYQHLETFLLKIGYLHPHTATAKMEKFRKLYNRANLSAEEVALLRGIVGHIDALWYLVNRNQ
ncbi:RNA methyltransferase, TrmH family, group 1 [Rippkaea orientalis PCC 8801]|uniref:tRNA (cytidine/uridine-2'-O-)-methyltransferase TrmJ n=1 Tax=Rippkaea orientalis (strain PCC 8801 / RF-1) TaxID=41431 RepID=B7K2G9_RIPO1|nr:RNA methyltransferase [Rippkaea orientalis]ACK66362.1 RNA methyltransferase, TrmH family, group 1 [Rippkaea orientalis PCC 8801]